jgi:4-hydroxythreonine-4-phosphate dehydrogenase
LGDVRGVGPEIALKAVAMELARDPHGARYVLLGDRGHIAYWWHRLGCAFPIAAPASSAANLDPAAPVTVLDPGRPALALSWGRAEPEAALAAVEWLEAGARLCLDGRLDALVTGPVNKASIVDAGIPFVGQTEWLARVAGSSRFAMMLLGADDRDRWLRVALVTTHLPLRAVPDAITGPGIEQAIELAAQACADLGLPRRRVGVCGLNPHAGEQGKLGSEEQSLIAPAVRACNARGLDVTGPWPADVLFHQAYRGDYDAVVAMYHDQGLGPLKTIGFDHGVNWTLGLPLIRTAPDHGTAYDIAGQAKANPESMRAALCLARDLARCRAAGQA